MDLRTTKIGPKLMHVTLELHIAVNAIGEAVGNATDDMLDILFTEFCIGK